MRLFIAVNLCDDTRSKLAVLRDELRSSSKRGNFTDKENMHITLAFLGECSEAQKDAAAKAMDMVRFNPFSLSVDRTGRFRRDGGDIWWAGVQNSNELSDVHADLISGLNAAGFGTERRRYDPHITLGREVITDAGPRKIEPFGETVSRIELMRSERINGKMVYTAIHEKGAVQ